MSKKNSDKKRKKIRLDWEEHYNNTPMEELHWYTEEIDPEVLEAMLKYCPPKKSVLDIGTGPGTMAIELTKLGYDVIATDIARSSINMAKKRAGRLANEIEFIVDDITDTKIEQKFDVIHDRGCFHTLDNVGVEKYVIIVHKLLKENGILLLKTFSVKEQRQDGPNRYSYEMIKELFSFYFKLLHYEETIYPSTLTVDPKALFCVLENKSIS